MTLAGSGDTTPNAPCNLQLLNSESGSGPQLGWLLAGQFSAAQPFLGGTLIPVPQSFVPLTSGGSLQFAWPDGLSPGSSFYVQAWFPAQDSNGSASSSSAVRVIVNELDS